MGSQKLSQVQREVLVGILLGDGSLQTESRGRTYRLRVCQSEEHREYLFHLYEILKDFTTSAPVRSTAIDSRNPDKTYVRWSFATTQQACFRFYGQLFYDEEGKKRVPQIIPKLLTPRSIAFWYMDDGAQKWRGKSKGVRFCTDNFSHCECQLLANLLSERYQLKTTLQKKGTSWRIHVSSYSHKLLKALIWEFLVESMHYKFPE